MKRRRNGEGSYTRDKNGMHRYACRYKDKLTGKRKRKYITAATASELDTKVAEWKERLKQEQKPSGNMTVADWCKRFQNDVKLSVKAKTFINYESAIRNHIIPTLGAIRLDKLDISQVQEMLNRLSGTGLSAQTVATVRRILCIILNKAVDYRLIDHNPAKLSRAPRVEVKPPVVMSKEEINRLLEFASDSRFLPATNDEGSLYLRQCYYVALRVSVDSGLRQGELRALQWADLKDKKINVNKAMEGNKVGSPKTKSSYRSVTLSQTTLIVLKDWRNYQERYCSKWGFWKVTDKSLIFTNGVGSPIDMQNLGKRWWHPLLKSSGMPEGIHWHSLRATMATLLLEAGVSLKVVSEKLGHSKTSVSLEKYCGITRGIEEQSAVIMDNILSGEDETTTIDVLHGADEAD